MGNEKNILVSDIVNGNVVSFYKEGWRFDVVRGIKTVNKRKPYKRSVTYILLERLGKVDLEKVREVYEYIDGKTVKKSLMSDLFE